jgi:hypothetical protein
MTMLYRRLAWLAGSALALGCGTSDTNGDGGDDTAGSTAQTVSDDGGPGNPSAGSADATSAGPSTTSGAHGDDGPPPIWFDLGTIPDAPTFCQQGTGEVEASYIWIANSSQGTISKIDTQTLIEEGRYQTRPDPSGDPSRTSVSLTGNVAVANRNGGLSKFYANHDECDDNGNNNGVANTSTNSTWLPWGTDECLAWYTPMAYSSQRPVAWTQGEFDTAACKTVNEKVWTSGANGSSIEVLLVDGDTGVIEETIPIPGVPADFYGIYGAAVDSEGNFWGSQLGIGQLVHVDLQTLQVDTWPMATSGYGMTVDADGYVWTCSGSAGRFDPATETWQTAGVGGGGGCMADGNGTLWLASNPLVGIDTQTLAVQYSLPLPEYVHGVSIDFEGYVWGVSLFGTNAYRVDPSTGLFDTFTGLVSPYTYSDMTGFALSNVGGGGAPSG